MEPTEETPLIEVLKLGLEKYLDKLQEISSQASKEFALENVSFVFFKEKQHSRRNNTFDLVFFCVWGYIKSLFECKPSSLWSKYILFTLVKIYSSSC